MRRVEGGYALAWSESENWRKKNFNDLGEILFILVGPIPATARKLMSFRSDSYASGVMNIRDKALEILRDPQRTIPPLHAIHTLCTNNMMYN